MTAESDRIIDCMARMKGENQPFAVATVVRTRDATSAKAGAKAVLRADGAVVGWIGGGCTLGAVKKAAAQALVDGRARMLRIRPAGAEGEAEEVEEIDENVMDFESHCPSRGSLDVFVEPVLPRPSILIAGASPTARALCDLAARAGFAVTVAALPEDLEPFAEADRLIEGFDLASDPRAASGFVVIATQGRRDREATAAALATGAPYVAFVGSRRKAAALREGLVEAGHDRQDVAAIRAPAGLDIGAATPEEIAVSVLADIIRERRLGDSPEDRRVPAAAGDADEARTGAGDRQGGR